jgi:uncharacterized protein YraI
MRTPRFSSRSRWLVVFALILSLLANGHQPRQAISATNLDVGGSAVIVDANGDDVRLRDKPGFHGDVIDLFPEGTVVDVLDGLFVASDGSLWYQVEVGGETGYMISDYLSSAESDADRGSATVTSALNLRDGPSTSDAVILVMPEGAVVTVNGGSSNGFLPVTYRGMEGWAHGSYLSSDGSSDGGGSTGTATTTSALNLRDGPSTSDAVLLVMPAGADVVLTGESENGFASVEYRGTAGWAFADYLMTGDDSGSAPGDEAVATSALNLRADPSTSAEILRVMPSGASVSVNGAADNGFYPVTFRGSDGWAHREYLDFDGIGAPVGASDIVWPVTGGEWYVSQGYNGFSHYNGGGSYQYAYSFDLARTDGSTAWQSVYAPVSGTVSWTEPASGGITIDLENGYAVAMFHVTLDGSFQPGDRIAQGDYVGLLSGPGGDGFVDNFAHIHLTVWQTTDGGNFSRVAIPFTGNNAISGQEFSGSGAYNQWSGTVFFP